MNVLISNEGIPLLSDFGLAVIAEELTQLPISTVLTGAGNCRWMSYELLFCDNEDAIPSKESDIWALGMVVIEVWHACFVLLAPDGRLIFCCVAYDAPPPVLGAQERQSSYFSSRQGRTSCETRDRNCSHWIQR